MPTDNALYAISPLVITLIALPALLLATEAGFRLARRRFHRAGPASAPPPGRAQLTALEAAILGILGLILGFSFSISQSRFDARRRLIIDEANAIGTTYLRAQLLAEPLRADTTALLAQYAASRIPAPNAEAIAQAIADSKRLHTQLWDQVALAARSERNPMIVMIFAQSVNQMIDLHSARVAAHLYRAPAVQILLLYLAAALALGVMGYASGLDGQRNTFPVTIMVLLVIIVLHLIVDLEQPLSGMIRASQLPLIEVRDTILAASSTSPAPPAPSPAPPPP